MVKSYNYIYDFEGLAKELYRVLKPDGFLVWNEKEQVQNGVKNMIFYEHAFFFCSLNFKLDDNIIAYNHNIMPVNYNRHKNVYKICFVFFKNKHKNINFINEKIKNSGDARVLYKGEKILRYLKNYREEKTQPLEKKLENIFTYEQKGISIPHTARMNIGICKKLIYSFSNEGDIILDPFNGAGTTCIIAKEMNRNYIGFELEQRYVDDCKEYLKNMQERLL